MKNLFLFLTVVLFNSNVQSQNENISKDFDGNTPRSITTQYLDQMQSNSDAIDPWTSIGPFGGDVLDIAVDPLNPQTIFAAAGIPYISHDGGETWQFIESLLNLAPSGIGTFEAAANGVIYASGPYSYYKIFRSTDGGDTWQQKSIPVNGAGYDIACDPNDTNVVYMGLNSVLGSSSNNVIVKSDNGGDNWTYFNMTSVLPVGWSVVNLVVDPDDSQVIFAIGNSGISDAAVVATFDGGATWVNKTANLPSGKPYNSLTIADGNVYISGGQLFGGQVMGVYKTSDYGTSWQNISSSFPNHVSNAVLIDPNDANRMYVATEGDGIYYTLDGGSNWNFNTSGAGDNGAARCMAFEPGNTDVVYAGFLSLAICKSIDGGSSWEYSNKGIATLLTNDIEVDPNDPLNILVGFEAENSGGCYLSNDGGNLWQLVDNLPGTRFSQVTFGPDGSLYAWSNGPSSIAPEGLYKSIDGGATWENKGPNIGNNFETEIFSLTTSSTFPNRIYIGGNNFGLNGWESMIYRSTNGGDDWENIFIGNEYESFNFIFIDPNSNDANMYAAYSSQSDHAGFIKSIDGGTNWLPINNGISSDNKWGGAIVCEPGNSDVLYGGVGGYGGMTGSIYKSIDGGNNWMSTPLSLSNYSKVSDILISPLNNNIIYAATTTDGVYISSDEGTTWEVANDGLPAFNITGFSNAFLMDDVWQVCLSSFSNSAYKAAVYEPGTTGFNPRVNSYDNLFVFPNPSSGDCYLRIPENHPQINLLQIMNSQGQLIVETAHPQVSGNSIKLTDGLIPGFWFWRVQFDGGDETGSFIVK